MTAALERRYRRLLRCYPARHRRIYEGEMLAVLLAGARPGQRYPGLRETADLLRSALAARLSAMVIALGRRRWGEAAAAVGILAPAVLLGLAIRPAVVTLTWSVRLGDEVGGPAIWPPSPSWVEPLGWLAVLVCAVADWRLLAAAGAWAGVLGELVVLSLRYSSEPVVVLHTLGSFLLGLTAAAALSLAAVRKALGVARRGISVLDRRPATTFAASFLLVLGLTAADPFLSPITRFDGGIGIDHWGGNLWIVPGLMEGEPVGLVTEVGYLAAAALAALGLAWMAPPVRRRVLALFAPTATTVLLIWLTFGGYADSSVRFVPPVLLEPVQWAVLAITPTVALVIAVWLVHRCERRAHLIRLGEMRLAERGQ
jgi:hypothetical protein